MNNNPGGFDPKKQQGKTVTIFSTKKNTYDMPGFERAPSPYQNYMPPSGNFMPRTQDVAGSRGIFQTRKDYFRDETFNYSARGNPGFEESRGISSSYKQVFQDFMNNEFKSQIIQFRFEMTQIMDVSLKDFHEKSAKDQELFQAIKESVNHHTHQIEELEHKIGDFSANLGSVGSFKSFGEENSKMLNAQKMQRIEFQQQEVIRNFDRLKEEVEESLQASLEDYDQETYKKTSKVVSEIKAHMEEKIEKVFEHLTGKVTVLEKQIQNSSQIDDKIKEDITEKFNSHLQKNQEQIESTKWAVGNKADEIFLKNNMASFGLDRKIDQAKFELDSITAEIALVAEKIKQENMALSNKAVDLENKYYDQSLQYKTNSSFDLSLSPSKRSNSVDYNQKVAEIEKEFEEIKIDQRDLGNNITVQKIQLEKSRSSSPKNQSEEAHLRRLEEMIDGLSENIEILKNKAILQQQQDATKTRDKTQNPLYSSQKIESSPLFSSKDLEKSSPGSRMRRLSIHSSNSSPGHARGEEPMTKSSINLDQNKHHQKTHSTHSSPGVTRNSKENETTTIVIHSVTDQKFENNNNNNGTKVENEKPAEEEDDDDEIEVVLQIDDDGYLLDENGNYYFDKNGDKIKLDEKQIERLRIHNLIEEDD